MKRLTAKTIKKILLGVLVSDGALSSAKNSRFDLYSKNREYAEYILEVIQQITRSSAVLNVRRDKRGYVGYRVSSRSGPYWSTLRRRLYTHRKTLTSYVVKRLDEESMAHIWMCDGYLEHAKNRKLERVQNIGWFCLESFPKEELALLQNHLVKRWGIESSLVGKPWGYGYRIRIGGENLQKFISLVYPYILDCFKYKTPLFYKKRESAVELPNAGQYVHLYECVEDIVRHPLKKGKTATGTTSTS